VQLPFRIQEKEGHATIKHATSPSWHRSQGKAFFQEE